jgi:hypothetical protein
LDGEWMFSFVVDEDSEGRPLLTLSCDDANGATAATQHRRHRPRNTQENLILPREVNSSDLGRKYFAPSLEK